MAKVMVVCSALMVVIILAMPSLRCLVSCKEKTCGYVLAMIKCYYLCVLISVFFSLYMIEESYSVKHFSIFRSCNLVEFATDHYAYEENFKALEILFTYHGSCILPHRLTILAHIPETCDPSLYADLLPELDGTDSVTFRSVMIDALTLSLSFSPLLLIPLRRSLLCRWLAAVSSRD